LLQRRPLLFSLTLAVALCLGIWARHAARGAGFWADDYAQQAMLEGRYPSPRASWDLFRFMGASRDDHQRIVDYGRDPWWTHPEYRLAMLRPLASLTHALDYKLFGHEATPQHDHSMVWWALLVAAAGAVLFTALPPLPAAAALLFFSLDESHTVPVLWLANRCALMATVFAFAALACHLRWRSSARGTGWRMASIALCALALCSGEYALASVGYLICVELASPPARSSRLQAILPFLVLSVLYLVSSAALGYGGSAHSGLYTSPLGAPLEFAGKALAGLPVMLGELVLGVPADWWSFGSPWPEQLRAALSIDPAQWQRVPAWPVWQLTLGVLSLLITLGLLRWLRPRSSPEQQRALIWLVAGATLGLLPVMGSFITTRLALPSALGFAALFGAVLCQGLSQQQGRLAALALGAILLYTHGYRAFVQSQSTTAFYTLVAQSRTQWPLTAALDDAKAASQRLVMVASADANDAAYIPFVRMAWGRAALQGFRVLSGSPGSHAVTRVDAHTLEVRVTDDFGLANSVAGSLTRPASEPLANGAKVSVAGMDVTVLQTHQGQPTHMRFRFDVPLESEQLVFVESTTKGLQRLALPAVGESIQLPRPVMPNLAWLAGP
jgi:hypothetical protein